MRVLYVNKLKPFLFCQIQSNEIFHSHAASEHDANFPIKNLLRILAQQILKSIY